MAIIRKIATLIVLIASVGSAIWIWQYQPQPKLLRLTLSSEVQGEQRIDTFFYEKNQDPAGIAHQNASDFSEARDFYFLYPQHFVADATVVHLGSVASEWKIDSIEARAHFFMFSLEAYHWPFRSVPELIFTNQKSTSIEIDESLVVKDSVRRPRLHLNLDLDNAIEKPDFVLIKLLFIVAICGVLVMMFNGYIWRLLTTRETDFRNFETIYYKSLNDRRLWMVLGCLIAFAILLFKTSTHWHYPSLHIEDSMEFSDFASGRLSLLSSDAYFYYRGYFVFVSKWLGALANLFPITWQAHMYMLLGCLMMFAAVTVVSYNGMFRSPLALTIAPAAILFGAFTNQVFYVSLTGVLFSSTVLAMGMIIRPLPKSSWWLLLYCLLTAALVWSGPYGAQMLPFAVGSILLFGDKKKTAFLVFVIIAAVLYAGSSQPGMVQLDNLLDSKVRIALFNGLTEYIFLLQLFGEVDYRIGLAIVVMIVVAFYFFRRDHLFTKLSLIFLMTGLSSFMAYFISFKYHQYQGLILSSHIGISQMCWILFLLLCVDRISRAINRNLSILSSNSHWAVSQKWQIGFAVLVVLIFASMLIRKDLRLLSQERILPSAEMHEFFAAVDDVKKMDMPPGHFAQLWIKNQYLFSTTFVRRAEPSATTPIPTSMLPKSAQPFAIEVDFNRNVNTMFEVNVRRGAVREITSTSEINWRDIELLKQ